MKKVLKFLVLFVMAFVLVGCDTNSDDVEIKGVSVTGSSNVVKVNQTVQLEAKVFPEKADQSINWKSNNPEVATVNERGLVTGCSEGKATITATSIKDETVSGDFIILVEKEAEVVIEPTSVTITAEGDVKNCKIGETLNLSAIVYPQETNQSVTWKSSDETVATVTKGKVKGLKAGTVIITATSKNFETVFGTIEITIDPSDDPVVTQDWDKMAYTTHEEYLNSEDNKALKVKGVVTYICPEKEGTASYYLQNGTEGYYVYAQNVLIFSVEVGSVYEVGGFKKYFRGLNEIVNVEYCEKIDETISFTVNDINNIDSSNLDATKPYQASFVTATAKLTDVTVSDTKAYSFYGTINGKSTTFRVDPSNMSDDEFKEINKKLLSAIKNTDFTFKGLMVAFGYGKAEPQIYIVDADHLTFDEMSTKELLQAISNSLSIIETIPFSVDKIVLPSSIDGWDDVTLVWTSNNTLINVQTGTVNHSGEDVTVTLTVKLTYNGETFDKTFDVLVLALDNTKYEVLATLDLDDAADADKYGNSSTKSRYNEGIIELGTPKLNWMLRNALIAATTSDKFEGKFSIRAKTGKDSASTARIEVQHDDEYNVVEFAAATYGNDKNGAQIKIEYSTDSGTTWTASSQIVTINSNTFVTYRIKLPEGAKRVAIVVVENTGNRVNIDNIKLMK